MFFLHTILFNYFLVKYVSLQLIDLSNSFQKYDENAAHEAEHFLKEFDREAAEMCNRVANVEWKYSTNVTDFNRRRMYEEHSVAAKFECLTWKRASAFNCNQIPDPNIRRQLYRIVSQGKCGLGADKFSEYRHVIGLMKDTFNSVKICPFRKPHIPFQPISPFSSNSQETKPDYYETTMNRNTCDLKLDPDLIGVFDVSRDEPELLYFWTVWHEKVGPPIRNSFMRYIDLANQAAQAHGFNDAGEQMRSIYEDPDLFFTVQDLWTQIQPLYKQLFTYVRQKLWSHYGDSVIRRDGPMPAHIFGNVWAQNWQSIWDLVKPPGPSQTPNITGEMARHGFTSLKIFQIAEEFFTSMGLLPMSPEFWRNSMLQKPNDRHIQCTASAWDFCNNIDYRIKQCTHITADDLVNAHHEMTHVQYYMHYSSQPFVYREAPNPAFHEAVAHAIGLSAAGPVHLQRIGIYNTASQLSSNSMLTIEYLLDLALDKLPFLAFSIALEKWRWFVFEKGPIGMNSRWWEMKLRYQGIIPPISRSAEHFDPATKYHIISDQDYIKYFIATVLQFQIYAELCHSSGHVGPLHLCDFYRSRSAGRILREIMQYGASMSPKQLIKLLSNDRASHITANHLLNFFQPLQTWLELQNLQEPIIGWNSNIDDVLLFKSIRSRSSKRSTFIGLLIASFYFIYVLSISM